MGNIFDLQRTSRYRLKAIGDSLDSIQDPGDPQAPFLLAKTTTSGVYPTSPNVYFLVQPIKVTGPETEGGSVTTTPFGPTMLAANAGNAVPPISTVVRVYCTARAFVFVYNNV